MNQISERCQQKLPDMIDRRLPIWLSLSILDVLLQDISKLNQFSELNSKLLDHLVVMVNSSGFVTFNDSTEFLVECSKLFLHIFGFISFIKLLFFNFGCLSSVLRRSNDFVLNRFWSWLFLLSCNSLNRLLERLILLVI